MENENEEVTYYDVIERDREWWDTKHPNLFTEPLMGNFENGEYGEFNIQLYASDGKAYVEIHQDVGRGPYAGQDKWAWIKSYEVSEFRELCGEAPYSIQIENQQDNGFEGMKSCTLFIEKEQVRQIMEAAQPFVVCAEQQADRIRAEQEDELER